MSALLANRLVSDSYTATAGPSRSVQRGLNSGFCEQGKLMMRHEKGIQHFERLVFEALTRDVRPEPRR